jgi:hypothetical protein
VAAMKRVLNNAFMIEPVQHPRDSGPDRLAREDAAFDDGVDERWGRGGRPPPGARGDIVGSRSPKPTGSQRWFTEGDHVRFGDRHGVVQASFSDGFHYVFVPADGQLHAVPNDQLERDDEE